ncbi:MAG: V-type ATP synthase subunit E [Spirochaetota bacterium]
MKTEGDSFKTASVDKEGEGKNALISGIEEEASGEAERIISEAKKYAQERLADAKRQVQSIIEEAQRKAEAQSSIARSRVLAGLKTEIKRRSMRIQESIVQEVIEKAKSEIRAMSSEPNYKDVLEKWIVEAAIGLGADSAVVNASAGERALIDRVLLGSAEKRVKELTGREVKLMLSTAQPLSRQGVVLTAADGKTAYNNQVETRFLRFHPRIRRLIYDKLFGA